MFICNKSSLFLVYTNPAPQPHSGYIERLGDLGLEDESFDVIISNCVVNLSPDKEAVLREAYRLLKPGGEMYFSDVYSSARCPVALVRNDMLWGECVSGALYWNDFMRLSRSCGFKDPRLVKSSSITMANAAVTSILQGIDFYSATYRLWKIPGLDADCEDYGQAVIYNGSMDGRPWYFDLDDHHRIWTGKVKKHIFFIYEYLKYIFFRSFLSVFVSICAPYIVGSTQS